MLRQSPLALLLTVAVGVHGPEMHLVFLHGLLEVLLSLLHDPALHLLGADFFVAVDVDPGQLGGKESNE